MDSLVTEIMEIHHNKKVDAPSGSALSLSEAIANGRKVIQWTESSIEIWNLAS